ncbi:MAG: hypothetical protein KGD63_09440 [Candidatus Lokiarchaeota archaeon]|nr:hypothetical protein [Candidatus Lokiarchaeota archaeon]
MNSNAKDLQSNYEQKFKELSDQHLQMQNYINELESNNELKDREIYRLKNENSQIISQLHKLQLSSSINLHPSPKLNLQNPEKTASQQNQNNQSNYKESELVNPETYSKQSSSYKRECPKCGAMGFAIKEFEDKNRIISYIPRRIYAMKRVCTKCSHEF